MRKTPSVALAVTVLVATFGLTACGQKRWCEHDATDTKVSDRYCKNNVPGYEWESGKSGGGHGTKTKTKSKTNTKTRR